MIPQLYDAQATPPGEQAMFQRIRELPDEWIALHQLHLPAYRGERKTEIDFLLLIPRLGLLVIEVKSHPRIAFDDMGWHFGTQPPDARGPFTQAEDAAQTLRRRITTQFPHLHSCSYQRCVIFPMAQFRSTSVSWNTWELLDREALCRLTTGAQLAKAIESGFLQSHAALVTSVGGPRLPTPPRPLSTDDLIALQAWLRPHLQTSKPRTLVSLRHNSLSEVTSSQMQALDGMVDNPRLLVTGPAGTGKTVLATHVARRWKHAGLRPAFICFNQLLATELTKHPDLDGIPTMTVHALMRRCADLQVIPADAGASFWNADLPEMASTALIDGLNPFPFIDSLVIDEAQDFIAAQPILDFLELLLHDQWPRSRWLMAGDFSQQVFYSSPTDTVRALSRITSIDGVHCCCDVRLHDNLRNTEHIGTAAVHYAGLPSDTYRAFLRSDGSPSDISILKHADEQSLAHALETALNGMRHAGIPAEDTALLSLAPLSPALAGMLRARLGVHKWDGRGRHAGVATVQRFKGLEADGVVLFNASLDGRTPLRELLYVGCTRATMRLTMVLPFSVHDQVLTNAITRM